MKEKRKNQQEEAALPPEEEAQPAEEVCGRSEGEDPECAEQQPAAEQPAEPSAEQADAAVFQAQAEDFKRKWYAVTAEYENYRRRTANDAARRYREGRADVVSKLFPIADNLGRALAACGDEATRRGIELVVKAFEKILEEEKIAVIDPVGAPFDAEKHEAIMAVDPREGEESGTVREVYLKGYEQEGKVLRFAQVVVVK